MTRMIMILITTTVELWLRFSPNLKLSSRLLDSLGALPQQPQADSETRIRVRVDDSEAEL
jgi:hypothetical protein